MQYNKVEDHPRLRGEKPRKTLPLRFFAGSPPLTRGKDRSAQEARCEKRITPAYAGKRQSFLPHRHSEEDHPRLRGEKLKIWPNHFTPLGSPPLTRGKDDRILERCFPLRITPAYAGKSAVVDRRRATLQDHPRLRGEKADGHATYKRNLGSPPLTRGKGKLSVESLFDRRITPAYAGKSRRPDGCMRTGGDHPRLRGEK